MPAHSQKDDHDIYKLDLKKDAILIGTGAVVTFMGDRLLHNQQQPSLAEIGLLDKNDLWSVDRPATDNYSQTALRITDIILFTSATLPFAMYATNRCRGEELDILVMATETFLITNGITNIIKASTNRYRPFNYNDAVSVETKLSRGSNRSFFSGHAATTASLCFLSAQALTDMHPHWGKKKYIVWSTAAILPLVVSYGRYKAGKHFATDVITGYVFGAAIGMLIPRLHRRKNMNLHLSLNSLSLQKRF